MPESKPVLAKSILSLASGFIGSYDYTITPYAGCTFGCSYCYVPTVFYQRRLASSWGFSVGPKMNAPELLLRDARAGKLERKRIYLSPNTDPYLGQEREYELTRQMLKVFVEYPPALLVIQTRSPLVLRDMALLGQLGGRVVVAISITTNREDVRALFERRCAPIQKRVDALAKLHAAGIRTQASLAPLLPCVPNALAQLVSAHCDWVVAQALKKHGPGARTWTPGQAIIQEHGWEDWLQGGVAVTEAMRQLQAFFGPRYHEAQEGFGLGWLQEGGTDTTS